MSRIDNLEGRAKSLIAEELDISVDRISIESHFMKDLGADSLAIVNLILTMEDAFNIEISDDEAEKIKSFGDALNYLKAKCTG